MTTQNMPLQPFFLKGNEGQATWFLTSRMITKATGELTGGALTVIEVHQAPGETRPGTFTIARMKCSI